MEITEKNSKEGYETYLKAKKRNIEEILYKYKKVRDKSISFEDASIKKRKIGQSEIEGDKERGKEKCKNDR